MYNSKNLQTGQLPQEHLSFLQNLLNFNLKQEVNDNLSICMDEHSPCGLTITGDIKIYQLLHDQKVMALLTPHGEVLYGLPSRSYFYCPNLITVAPVTRDKDICQSHLIRGNDITTS